MKKKINEKNPKRVLILLPKKKRVNFNNDDALELDNRERK
jgi:hypothetical protein